VPLVVLVPAAYTVYAKSVAFSDPSLSNVMSNYSDAQRQWLAQNAKSIGYEFLDIIPRLQDDAATRALLYFPASIHPTSEGHRALAEAVAPKVKMILSPNGSGIVTQGQ
jgi:lysophospholipase L1-like esterase